MRGPVRFLGLWFFVAVALVACAGTGGGAVADVALDARGPDAPAPDGADVFHPGIVYAPHSVLDIPIERDVDGAFDIADPHVVKDGDTWYLYATQSKKDLVVWLSEDLVSWRRGGVVWRPTPGTWNAQGQVWAPHVERTEDGWFLYYTAGQRIGVARADGPEGPFVELLDHELVGGGYGGVGDGVFERPYDPDAERSDKPWDMDPLDFEEYAIDAFVLRSADGRRVLYFSAYSPISQIYAVPMRDWTTLADEPPQLVLSPDLQSWEGVVVEGVWVEEHDGSFFLSYSGNNAQSERYGVGVAVGPSPYGPFEKRAAGPLLHEDASAAFWGPGHHCVTDGAFGDRILFYHTKTTRELGYDRRLRYTPVAYDAQGDFVLSSPQP